MGDRVLYGYCVAHLAVSLLVFILLCGLVTEHLRRVNKHRQRLNSRRAGRSASRAHRGDSTAKPSAKGDRHLGVHGAKLAPSSSPNHSIEIMEDGLPSKNPVSNCNNASNSSEDNQSSNTNSPINPVDPPQVRRLRSWTTAGMLRKRHSSMLFFDLYSSNDSLSNKQLICTFLTSVCILSSLGRSIQRLYLTLNSLNLTMNQSSMNCRVMLVSFSWLISLGKCSLYSLFVNRIDVAYSGTMYAYQERTIRLCYATVTILFFIAVVWSPFGVESMTQHSNLNSQGQRTNNEKSQISRCYGRASLPLSIFLTLFDTGFISCMVVMFVRPLRKLYQDSRISSTMGSQNLSQFQMRLLPIKYTVLSLTAVITTTVAIAILALTDYDIAIGIDNLINVACILLFSQHWCKEYWYLFGPFLRSLHSMRLVTEDTHLCICMMCDHFQSLRDYGKLSIAQRTLNNSSSQSSQVTIVGGDDEFELH